MEIFISSITVKRGLRSIRSSFLLLIITIIIIIIILSLYLEICGGGYNWNEREGNWRLGMGRQRRVKKKEN